MQSTSFIKRVISEPVRMVGGVRGILLAWWCFNLPWNLVSSLGVPGQLEITTWNVLAPCYKRLNPVTPPGMLSLFTARESSAAPLWETRCQEIACFIKDELKDSDIICLQGLIGQRCALNSATCMIGRPCLLTLALANCRILDASTSAPGFSQSSPFA